MNRSDRRAAGHRGPAPPIPPPIQAPPQKPFFDIYFDWLKRLTIRFQHLPPVGNPLQVTHEGEKWMVWYKGIKDGLFVYKSPMWGGPEKEVKNENQEKKVQS